MRFGIHYGVACALGTVVACSYDWGAPDGDGTGSSQPDVTWEEFLAQTYQEPWEDGVYIVNGDTPIENQKKLREFYDEVYGGETLIVHQSGGVDAKWNNTQKLNLTYCVSDTFGTRKATVVSALNTAAGNWEAAANINFIYVSAQDAGCTASNGNVVFDVRPVSGQPYLARSFFPNDTRSVRNVLIDSSAFGNTGWSLSGVLTHELGHTLGFRHEHTRPEAGQCFEDNNWRPLTPYDSTSVMHYPQCGGTGAPLTMSALDKQGAAALYGPPASTPPPSDPPPTPPPPPPATGTPRTGSHSATIARGQTVSYQPIAVVSGTRFDVSITGTGDADLYLRFGATPTATQWACRPYLNGSNETCSVDVPAGQTSAYMLVYGYS
ncbi:MAG TPA: M57 family metalloprotease, partial [Kofleriaceae bacterium]|nr:M57 family metalloprotease [Kofleriaceae bacterium]